MTFPVLLLKNLRYLIPLYAMPAQEQYKQYASHIGYKYHKVARISLNGVLSDKTYLRVKPLFGPI